MEKYYETNLNYYIKIKLTEEGRIIYKKHYAKYNCEAPKLNIDNEGYVRFQIHDFMNIFGERLFMGATLPCETNCKIQVKEQANEWHFVKDGDLPKEEENYKSYVVAFYSAKGSYAKGKPCWAELCYDTENKQWVDRETLDVLPYVNQEGVVIAWKEIVLPKEIKEND